jgi:hypothetical protein
MQLWRRQARVPAGLCMLKRWRSSWPANGDQGAQLGEQDKKGRMPSLCRPHGSATAEQRLREARQSRQPSKSRTGSSIGGAHCLKDFRLLCCNGRNRQTIFGRESLAIRRHVVTSPVAAAVAATRRALVTAFGRVRLTRVVALRAEAAGRGLARRDAHQLAVTPFPRPHLRPQM